MQRLRIGRLATRLAMIVYSTASGSLPMVRVFTLTYGDAAYAPEARYVARPLHAQARAYHIAAASAEVAAIAAPAYMLPDCHGNGAAAYAQPRYSLVPALTDWQAEVIDAIRHLRRWHCYSDSPS